MTHPPRCEADTARNCRQSWRRRGHLRQRQAQRRPRRRRWKGTRPRQGRRRPGLHHHRTRHLRRSRLPLESAWSQPEPSGTTTTHPVRRGRHRQEETGNEASPQRQPHRRWRPATRPYRRRLPRAPAKPVLIAPVLESLLRPSTEEAQDAGCPISPTRPVRPGARSSGPAPVLRVKPAAHRYPGGNIHPTPNRHPGSDSHPRANVHPGLSPDQRFRNHAAVSNHGRQG